MGFILETAARRGAGQVASAVELILGDGEMADASIVTLRGSRHRLVGTVSGRFKIMLGTSGGMCGRMGEESMS